MTSSGLISSSFYITSNQFPPISWLAFCCSKTMFIWFEHIESNRIACLCVDVIIFYREIHYHNRLMLSIPFFIFWQGWCIIWDDFIHLLYIVFIIIISTQLLSQLNFFWLLFCRRCHATIKYQLEITMMNNYQHWINCSIINYMKNSNVASTLVFALSQFDYVQHFFYY